MFYSESDFYSNANDPFDMNDVYRYEEDELEDWEDQIEDDEATMRGY